MSGPPPSPARPTRISGHFRRWVTLRDQPSRLGAALAGLACVLLVLLFWHVLTVGEPPETRIIGPVTLPSPKETAESFPSLWFDRALARSAVWSLGRVIGGFILAIAIGVPLGVIAGSFKRVYAFLNPLSIFGRNIPVAALVGLTFIWFFGETQKVVFIFLASVPFVFFNSASAVDSVPDAYLDTAYTLGARFTPLHGVQWAAAMAAAYGVLLGLAHVAMEGWPPVAEAGGEIPAFWKWGLARSAGIGLVFGFLLWFPIVSFQAIRKVLFPLALPDIMNSLRLLFGLAFGYIMLAEAIDPQYGLGAIIETSRRLGRPDHVFLVLIIIAILAYGIDRGLLWAHGWLFPYRNTGEK